MESVKNISWKYTPRLPYPSLYLGSGLVVYRLRQTFMPLRHDAPIIQARRGQPFTFVKEYQFASEVFVIRFEDGCEMDVWLWQIYEPNDP